MLLQVGSERPYLITWTITLRILRSLRCFGRWYTVMKKKSLLMPTCSRFLRQWNMRSPQPCGYVLLIVDLIQYDGSNTCAERRQFAYSFQLLTTEDNLWQREKTLFDILNLRFVILRPRSGRTLRKSPKLLPPQCGVVFVCFADCGRSPVQPLKPLETSLSLFLKSE